jgi:PAS domain S-box-containing protein
MNLSGDLARTLLDLAPDATVIVDAHGTIVFANAQMERTFGYAPSELTGVPVETLLPARFRGAHAAHRSAFAARAKSRPMGEGLTLFGQHKSGREFPVEISLSPVYTDDGPLVVAAVRDATARRTTERELIEANRAKGRLLAAASHDLRQPVQTLNLLNQAALHRAEHDATLRDLLERQQTALDTMAALLASVLDVSKLDSGALQPNVAPRSIGDVFARLRSDFEPHAEARGLALVVEPTHEAGLTDAELLRRLLGNLVSNALRYTDRGGVTVTCRRDGDFLTITVEDTGIGIPAHDIDRVFEEFYQVDRGPKRAEGLGLGLSIVRRLADLLGHRLTVESHLGSGTVFSVRVPRAELAAAPEAHVFPHDEAATTGKRVLVVDDEATVAHATSLLLELEGFVVDVAHGLTDALELTRAHTPDVVVSDFHLQGNTTGADVIASIRAQAGAAIPAVFVTGDTSKFARSGTQIAAAIVLSKPTRAEDLLGAVRAHLASAR